MNWETEGEIRCLYANIKPIKKFKLASVYRSGDKWRCVMFPGTTELFTSLGGAIIFCEDFLRGFRNDLLSSKENYRWEERVYGFRLMFPVEIIAKHKNEHFFSYLKNGVASITLSNGFHHGELSWLPVFVDSKDLEYVKSYCLETLKKIYHNIAIQMVGNCLG